MQSNASPPNSPRPVGGFIQRAYAGISRRTRAGLASAVRTVQDRTLPLLVLGAIAAAFFATLVLHATPEIVFGILFIGCLTAVLETKMHNDNRDR
jgi:hypothetical protein